jgi:hypothetical protein
MLTSHPQLAVANDTHFIPRAIGNVPPGVDPLLTDEIVERVRNYHRFPRLGLPDEVVLAAASRSRTYKEFISALYSAYARQYGKPLGGEKTPDYVRHLPMLHGLFPWAKMVHLIRDGRNVALSVMEWARVNKGPGRFRLWQENPIAVCALWWHWQVSTGRRDGIALGPEWYYEVYYEDLVDRPEQVLRDLCEYLEIPFAVEMLCYYKGKTRYEPGLSAKKAYLPPTPGLREWRTQMARRDVELFEALAGDLLAICGYSPGVGVVSSEIEVLSGQLRSKWESELAERQAKKAKRLSMPAGGGAGDLS